MHPRLDISDFIRRGIKAHGKKYDYSKVRYKNNCTKVIITCPIHGEFHQSPECHWRGQGCPDCGNKKISETLRHNKERFVDNARHVHRRRYDYTKVEYINALTKVIVICPVHGEYQQTPGDHLSGRGCKKCGVDTRAKKQRLTQDKFLERAKNTHGEFYRYSKAQYLHAKQRVVVICPIHGDFKQLPFDHLSGKGCFECSVISRADKRRLTKNEFVAKARAIHLDRYDYSKVQYKNNTTKITITCKKHGDFEQRPGHHLSGKGCSKCGNERTLTSPHSPRRRRTTDEFIQVAQKVHGDRYDYSEVDYQGDRTTVSIICSVHGRFDQTPGTHLSGSGRRPCGCERRGKIRRLGKSEFIRRANIRHDDFYDYSNVKYRSAHEKIGIVCREHGPFMQVPNSHLQGCGCKKCFREELAKSLVWDTHQFVDKAREVHDDTYDYSKVDYVNARENVVVVCRTHGRFEQTPYQHLSGSGCPRCKNKAEGRIAEYLEERAIVHRGHRIENRFFDFYLPDYNVVIERDGEQHYHPVSLFVAGSDPDEYLKIQQENDAYKTRLATNAGLAVARIPFWLTVEEERTEIENILKGHPSFPDVPDLDQQYDQPGPKTKRSTKSRRNN